MSEEQAEYLPDEADKLAEAGYVSEAIEMLGRGYNQPAAVIDPPRTLHAIQDGGMVEYRAWGWVKMSAKFIGHIGKLRGSKLSTWQTIALSIDESGKCNLSVPEIARLTGYSVSETRAAIGELNEMGYLSVERKSGKRSIYSPEFAARSTSSPTDQPKTDPTRKTTPPVGTGKCADDPSSLSIENITPSINRVKRVNTGDDSKSTYAKKGDLVDGLIALSQSPGAKRAARLEEIYSALSVALHVNTSGRRWESFVKFVDDRQENYGEPLGTFLSWLVSQKGFNPQFWPPNRMMEFWPQAFLDPAQEDRPEYRKFQFEDD